MKNIGIWMDKEKAHIVRLQEGREEFETLLSEVDFFRPKGGARSKTRWGPQDVIQDSKYLEREKHQMRTYFERLAKVVSDADRLVIFGPAKANDRFMAELLKRNKSLASRVKAVEKADSMTDNQVRALVRDFFISTE